MLIRGPTTSTQTAKGSILGCSPLQAVRTWWNWPTEYVERLFHQLHLRYESQQEQPKFGARGPRSYTINYVCD